MGFLHGHEQRELTVSFCICHVRVLVTACFAGSWQVIANITELLEIWTFVPHHYLQKALEMRDKDYLENGKTLRDSLATVFPPGNVNKRIKVDKDVVPKCRRFLQYPRNAHRLKLRHEEDILHPVQLLFY